MSNEDSDDDALLPSAAECEVRCQQFAEVTSTDSALAMYYLQNRHWILEAAIDAYFRGEHPEGPEDSDISEGEDKGSEEAEHVNKRQKITEKYDAFAKEKEEILVKKKEEKEMSNAAQVVPNVPSTPKRLRLMSWNIDGLDDKSLIARTKAVCNTILKEEPDIVFLQEVITSTQLLLEAHCPGYQLIPADNQNYYVVTLLKKDVFTNVSHKVVPYPSSLMFRNLLNISAKVHNVQFEFMTTHLESTKEHADERKLQLKLGFQLMANTDPSKIVLYGGDLNLRDSEVAEVGVPPSIVDVWEASGKRPEAAYTWDAQRNVNIKIPSTFKPRLRFDRLYLRQSVPKPCIKLRYLELVGLEKVPNHHAFPSDHWGLLLHLDVL